MTTKEEYWKARIANLKAHVSFAEVLRSEGIDIWADRETQFSCPLHGTGQDRTPSARYYPHTDSTYCFTCQKARDVVSWTQERKNMSYLEAVKLLEAAYHVPHIEGYQDFTERQFQTDQDDLKKDLANLQNKRKEALTVTPAMALQVLENFISTYATQLGQKTSLKAYRYVDYLKQDIELGRLTEEEALTQIKRLYGKVSDYLHKD